MKAKVEAGVLHVEGTPKELAEFSRELGIHEAAGSPPSEPASGKGVPELAPASLVSYLSRVRSVPRSQLEQWVRANPTGNANQFLREVVHADPSVRFTGDLHRVYVTAYNRIARTHRKLGIPAPTKGG